MNRGVLLFAAGLLCGVAVAAMLGIGSTGDAERTGSRVDGSESGLAAPGMTSGPAGRGASRRPAKGARKEGAIHSPAGHEELLVYIASLGRIEDLEEINFMELIRNASVVAAMSEREVEGMLEMLLADESEEEENGGEMRVVFEAVLLARLGEVNGPEAMRKIMEGDLGSRWAGDEDDLAAIVLSSWVGADPGGAADWFGRAAGSDPKFRELIGDNDVQAAFFSAMARADGERAHAMIRELGSQVEGGVEAVARHEQTTEGLETLLEATAGDGREDVLRELSGRDPDAARTWLDDQPKTLEEREDLVRVVGRALLNRDPAEGAAYLLSQELPEEQQGARYVEITQHWVRRDAEEAQAWLREQPDTPVRDAAEQVMAVRLGNEEDFQSAFQWAGQVTDEEARASTLQRVMDEGWQRDEQRLSPAAEDAAREAGYEDEVATYVQRRQEQD